MNIGNISLTSSSWIFRLRHGHSPRSEDPFHEVEPVMPP